MSDRAATPVREVIPGTRRYTQHTIYELADSIRARDELTYEHCRRVAIYANRLARQMGWGRRAARDIALAGLAHDLGKTWIDNSVLNKESALSNDEWHEMQRHPAIAARILEMYGVPWEIVEVVLHHHEAWDGRGYPDHLKGDAIPAGARLLALVDVFDALTSARPYKEAMSMEAARERIAAGKGAHFEPVATEAFFRLLDSRSDFVLPPRVEPTEDIHPLWARHDFLDE